MVLIVKAAKSQYAYLRAIKIGRNADSVEWNSMHNETGRLANWKIAEYACDPQLPTQEFRHKLKVEKGL